MGIPDLLEGFLVEAQGYVNELRQYLGKPDDPASLEALQQMHRCWHTLSGAAEMLELNKLAELTTPPEEMLEALIENEESLTQEDRLELEQKLEAVQAHLYELEGKQSDNAPSIDIPTELLEIFVLEAIEHNQAIAQNLERLRDEPDDQAAISELRRVIHTLKGASASVGLDDMARLSHLMEDLLDQVLTFGDSLSSEVYDLLNDTADTLDSLIETGQIGQRSSVLDSIETRFAALLGNKYAAPAAPRQQIEITKPDIPESMLRIPQDRIDQLVNRVGEVVINRATIEEHIHAFDSLLAELDHSTKRLQRVTGDLDTQIRNVSGNNHEVQESNFDPLEMEQYSLLYQYARELEEIAADTSNINSQLHLATDDLDSSVSRERRLTTELQDGLMSTRLVPFHEIEFRLRRIVHRTARDLDKSVDLHVIGGETKVDKTILTTLTDPLMHLLRNAIDHGIESSEGRQATGKPAEGLITLNVSRERNRVLIRLSDDGAGVDLARVQARAVRLGLIDPDEERDPEGLLNLLFEEQFSLAESVSQTSGRGIGLSVVQHAVRQLQGTVRITTWPGKGTSFTIAVPITLAITNALFVECNGQTLAIPLDQISGVIRLEADTYQEIEDQQVLRRDGNILSTFHLTEFGSNGNTGKSSKARYGLVVDQVEQQTVVLVHELKGTHDIVVKSLGTHLRRVHGISGATITGDGSVVLILDLIEIIGGKSPIKDFDLSGTPPPSPITDSRLVLVVDDSLSVRRVVCNFLERSGWKAVAAKDGIEALEMIGSTRPDVALVDIEMPRMNGYELLSSLRSDPSLANIPVIFLTSRSADKHRERALQLGVNGYLVKPYQESQLLDEMERVMRRSHD